MSSLITPADLRDTSYFPTWSTCPALLQLVAHPDTSHLPTHAWFLLVQIVTIDYVNVDPINDTPGDMKFKLLVADRTGTQFNVLLRVSDEDSWYFPLYMLVEGYTLVLQGAVRSWLTLEEHGVVFQDMGRVKFVPYTLGYMMRINTRLIEARRMNGDKHVCFVCDGDCEDADKARCDGCGFFYFCCEECHYKGHNVTWHGLECSILKEHDMAALFSGNWHDILEFSNIVLPRV
ncbi:hypothetical protein BJX64DRAFT_289844 [Aspergillus heterothallicus]